MAAKKVKKTAYTLADVAELKEWFTQHKDEIPETLVMNNYMKYTKLRETVWWLIEVAEEHWEHRYFSGYYQRLIEIRKKMLGEEVR